MCVQIAELGITIKIFHRPGHVWKKKGGGFEDWNLFELFAYIKHLNDD